MNFRTGLLALLMILTSTHSNAEPTSTSFKVLALNTWGLPFLFVKKPVIRFKQIVQNITELQPDFVLLEESFSLLAKLHLRVDGYTYVNGPKAQKKLLGSGLRILSKHPILRSAFMHYHHCKAEDCLARKGAVLAVVELPNHQKLNLVATHLNASGEDRLRESQIKELIEFIDFFAEPNTPLVLGGDFNFDSTSLPYDFLINHRFGGELLKDSWPETQGAAPGITYDTTNNRYAHSYARKTHSPAQQERIDFLFHSSAVQPVKMEVVFQKEPLVSDHFGLWGEFNI